MEPAGIIASRADFRCGDAVGAELVTVRFMEALREAICAFVCVRREETLVSGSGSGEVEGERERERDGISGLRMGSWVLGEGLRGWCWGG